MSTLGPEVHGEVDLPGNRRAARRQKAKIECERGELAKVRGALGMTGSLQREEQCERVALQKLPWGGGASEDLKSTSEAARRTRGVLGGTG